MGYSNEYNKNKEGNREENCEIIISVATPPRRIGLAFDR